MCGMYMYVCMLFVYSVWCNMRSSDCMTDGSADWFRIEVVNLVNDR